MLKVEQNWRKKISRAKNNYSNNLHPLIHMIEVKNSRNKNNLNNFNGPNANYKIFFARLLCTQKHPQHFLLLIYTYSRRSTCIACETPKSEVPTSRSSRLSGIFPRTVRASTSWNSAHASLRCREVASRLRARPIDYSRYSLAMLITLSYLSYTLLHKCSFKSCYCLSFCALIV